MSKITENNLGSVNLISQSTNVTGDISTESDIRIDGTLIGNLITKGRLIIGPGGKIEGDVDSKSAEIEGMLIGKIKVEELLALKATSNFQGNITTGQLLIEPGANFSGNCVMIKEK
jgi:cytoskeletal protein CcmA (bactofilin family)